MLSQVHFVRESCNITNTKFCFILHALGIWDWMSFYRPCLALGMELLTDGTRWHGTPES